MFLGDGTDISNEETIRRMKVLSKAQTAFLKVVLIIKGFTCNIMLLLGLYLC